MYRYLIFGALGLVWGAISYPGMWISGIPVLGWIIAAPSFLAVFTISILGLPLGRGGFGQYWNMPDFLYVSCLTAFLFVAITFVASKLKARPTDSAENSP